MFAESPNRIYLANRGELKLPERVPPNFPGNWGFFNQMAATQPIANMVNCIVVVDGNGKLIEAWNQWDKLFEWGRGPHQVYISPYDPERHVWVVDDMRHVIYKFTHDGKRLVQTLGVLDEFGDNDDLTRLRRPTMIDWLPDGTFFVADGYGNTRVVKFNKDGKPLMKWGTRGTGPGQFNTPHGIAVGGSPARVFVSDRGNRRIQVFDVNGNFLEEWPGIAPHSMMMSADEHVWAVDSISDRIVKFDLSGHVEYSFGQFGTRPWLHVGDAPDFCGPGRQSVHRGSVRRTHAEVPAETGRQSDAARARPLAHADGGRDAMTSGRRNDDSRTLKRARYW